jgi:glycine/D-amino acid oxidase-like deaminating enzyme
VDARTVAVVGGGVLGTSTAAALARQGARVVLLTEAGLASGASGRSLSWLNSAGPYAPEYHRLRLLGLERYRALAGREHPDFLCFAGALSWSAPDDSARSRSAYAHLREIGYPAEWLAPADVAARVPGVDPAAVPGSGALLTPADGWVDLPRLVERLAADVAAAGGAVRTGTGRCEVVVADGAVTGVRTATGERVPADAVVLATGAGVPAAAARLGVELPDASPVSVLVRTLPVRTPLRAVLNTPRVSVRPTADGRLVLDSAWSEEELTRAGGAEVAPSTVQRLLAEASAELAGHPALTPDSVGTGRKPVPGDGQPVLGPLPAVAGLTVAFTHSGATLGLVAGELLAGEVLTGRPNPLLEPFRPARFAGG